MTRSLSLAAAAVAAATLAAGCSQPSGVKCSQPQQCPLDSTCADGICQALAPTLYVANTGADTITAFAIDPATGALRSGTAFEAGNDPTGLALHPSGRFLVAANTDNWGGTGTVSVFARRPGVPSGLVNVTGSPFAANTMALNVTVTPDGRYVYATNQYGFELTTFSIDAATGALEQAAFSPLPEYEAHSIVMHPSGQYFYTGAENTEIKGRAVAADGSYTDTPNSPYASPMANNWLSITPDGHFLYSVDAGSSISGSGTVRGFAVNAGTGELTQLAWSPLVIPGNQPMRTSAITPSGDFLYIGLWLANAVAAYRIDGVSGALTAVPGTPFAAGTNPKSIAIDDQGRFLYVANFGSSDVSAFSINPATGVLTPIGTYATGTNPKMVITAP